MSLLDVEGLRTYFTTMRGPVRAVDSVSFQIKEGQALGLAGESGCGKTTVALSLLRILPPEGKILGGKMLFKGTDIVRMKEKEMREKVRWKGISLVFQGAMNALNPVYKIGEQVVEAIKVHEPKTKKREALQRGKKLFEMVGLDPRRINNYPHEFSGGMKQRAVIAMALACNPDLLIADEPVTALDVIVQAQFLQLVKELREKLHLSMMLITHDLSVMAETCDLLAIMYAGKIVEYGDIAAVFKEPLHPYTQALIQAFPNIHGEKTAMVSIPGSPPDLLSPPTGCRFYPRCKYAMEICRKTEPLRAQAGNDHEVACHLVRTE